eukprot:gene23598-9126_t
MRNFRPLLRPSLLLLLLVVLSMHRAWAEQGAQADRKTKAGAKFKAVEFAPEAELINGIDDVDPEALQHAPKHAVQHYSMLSNSTACSTALRNAPQRALQQYSMLSNSMACSTAVQHALQQYGMLHSTTSCPTSLQHALQQYGVLYSNTALHITDPAAP